MKIYLATKFTHKDEYNRLKQTLEDHGHTITHDWSKDDVGQLEGQDLETYLMTCAGMSLFGVHEADVFVLLARPGMAGAFVELGFAMALSVPVIVLDAFREGNQENIFYHLPQCGAFQHVDSVGALLTILSNPKSHDPLDPIESIPGNN